VWALLKETDRQLKETDWQLGKPGNRFGEMVISNSEKIFALKNGFYVIEPSGETFDITAPEGIYSPREW